MSAAPAGPPRASRSPCAVGRSPVTQSNDMRALLRPTSSSTPRHCGNSRRWLSAPPTNSTSWLPRPPVSIRLAPAEIGGAEVVLADQLHTRAGRACLFGRLADAAGHPAAAIAAAAGRGHGANALRPSTPRATRRAYRSCQTCDMWSWGSSPLTGPAGVYASLPRGALPSHRLVCGASSSEPPTSMGLACRPVGAWRRPLMKQLDSTRAARARAHFHRRWTRGC
jgi:hypothetical protein